MHHINDKNHRNVTVYGAIGNCLNEPLFKLGKSTNEEDYGKFLHDLKMKVRLDLGEKPILLYDGHTAHSTKKNLTIMERYFIPINIPPHSCDFNSIERVWSCAKCIFKKMLM